MDLCSGWCFAVDQALQPSVRRNYALQVDLAISSALQWEGML